MSLWNLMFGIDGECQITCAVGLFWQTLRLFAQQIKKYSPAEERRLGTTSLMTSLTRR